MHPPKEIIIEISADQINPVSGRYIRIKAANIGIIPDGFYGAGTKAWLMIDEIIVN